MFGNTGGMSGIGAGQEALLGELMRGQGGPINSMGQAQTAPLVEQQQAQGNDLSSVIGKLGSTAAGAYLMKKGDNLASAAKVGGSTGNSVTDQDAFNGLAQGVVNGKNPQDVMRSQANMLKHIGMGFLR